MRRYAKVENGQVIQVDLPATGVLKDGRGVSCYNQLPESILMGEGWLPLVDNPPAYDPESEYLEQTDYTIGDSEVVVNYTVKQKDPITYEPTVLDYLVELDYRLSLIELGLI